MWAIVDDLASFGIYAVIGAIILGVLFWIFTKLIGARARFGGPASGGWRPPGRR